MTGHRTAFALAAPLVSALAALAGCATVANVLTGSDGGSSTDGATGHPSDAAPDSRGTNPDAVGPVVAEAGAPDAPTEPSDAPVDAPTKASDAPVDAPGEEPDAAACAALQSTALAQFQTLVEQNLSCSQNSDCVWSGGTFAGACVNACEFATDQAGMATVQAGAEQACQAYNAQACPAIEIECADGGALVCAGGSCVADFRVVPSSVEAPLTVDVCQTFELGFSDRPTAPNGYDPEEVAPHDMVIPVSGVSNATLYSDPNCTTPLAVQTITIPAGSYQVAFSLLPTTAGTCSFTVNEVDYDYTVQ